MISAWTLRALAAAAWRAGRPALAGAGLLLLAVAVYAIGIAPARQRLEEVRQRASVLQPPPATSVGMAGVGPAEQLARFRELFPADRDAMPVAAKVIAAAQRHGLVTRQVAYRFEEDKGLRLTRMEMAMPLKGEYVAIRRFLIDVHEEIPALALEQVQFERRAAGDRPVDARVVLRIHLGQR